MSLVIFEGIQYDTRHLPKNIDPKKCVDAAAWFEKNRTAAKETAAPSTKAADSKAAEIIKSAEVAAEAIAKDAETAAAAILAEANEAALPAGRPDTGKASAKPKG